ncbi:unnamed protein product [Tilletia controversa]|uniref:Methyltransferase type 11 domain-containing protein n=1 Tax=Tilletia controversa TaxID=13291 RepID=A0A8X7MVE8_9BASI|nr:hypothetical protein CF328_g402 [Tilletia controversa]KAE8248746.1 hypothetical protein A4X06_0g3542 [Tilletia controversa]CAD6919094.1 unnamed protein product [Tilletia controversa]CAD6944132.1 unnamed protein product [Tilletia controversa]
MGKLSQPTPAGAALQSQDPATYEQENVHDVYEVIASHFSSTRYKPWPLVSSFLETLPPGSIGADLGCGNGKYLHLRSILAPTDQGSESKQAKDRSILILGLDRSSNLIDIAATNFPSHGPVSDSAATAEQSRRARNEVCVGDALLSGYRSKSMDFAMSIATIHHFSTEQRRIESVQELIRIVKPVEVPSPSSEVTTPSPPPTGSGPGRFMIYVWALEQRGQSRRNFEAISSTAPVQDDAQAPEADTALAAREQDLLVPWVKTGSFPSQKPSKRPDHAVTDATSTPESQPPPSTVFQRFYHVFREGELESLVDKAAQTLDDGHLHQGGIEVVLQGSGWERGNWWGVWRVEKTRR